MICQFLLVSLILSGCFLQAAESEKVSAWDKAVSDPTAAHLARPSQIQYDWQEMELQLFVQIDPATHQGIEYDNGSTPMEELTFENLDVNEWCEIAKSFGAGEINFMLAHSGGFCMWPTETTDYHIGNTPYKDGKGDVVKEFAEACKKHGLKTGFFIWSPLSKEEQGYYGGYWTHGSDDTPVKNGKEASKITATRLKELQERMGSEDVVEIWLDLPRFLTLGKEIKEYFPNAVVQGVGCPDPLPTIRWPGTESGTVSYPCWSTVNKSKLGGTEVLSNGRPAPGNHNDNENQSQAADDPDGDYWAPHQADSPLHSRLSGSSHFWHWRKGAAECRYTVEDLMNMYEKSIGRNACLILNCAPMKDGKVHPDDIKRYKEFGDEIKHRFGRPLAVVEQVHGNEVVLDLGGMKTIDYTDLWEDYRYGHRIRGYVIEGFDGKKWIKIANGTAVGRRKIDPIKPVTVSKVRVRFTKNVGTPLIRKFQVHAGKVDPDSRISSKIKSSTDHISGLFPAENACDGDTNSYWVSAEGD
ncbi:MAG: alpha-L-fucosidase, partial [Desulfobulbaceae bacterium]|nr:alpha-L-fucosidase [Desulfobulbaceae bacterium]